MIVRVERIVSLLKGVSMPQKTIKMMEIAYTDYFMIRSKAVTIDPEKVTYIDWLR